MSHRRKSVLWVEKTISRINFPKSLISLTVSPIIQTPDQIIKRGVGQIETKVLAALESNDII